MKTEQTNFKEFSIRVPLELHELIEEDAKANKRSKSKHVNFLLEQHYAKELSAANHTEKTQEN